MRYINTENNLNAVWNCGNNFDYVNRKEIFKYQ